MEKVKKARETKVLGAIHFTGEARREKNLQLLLDKWQIANSKGEVTLNKNIEAAKKELANLEKMRKQLSANKQESVADYSALQSLYDKELSHIKEETLAAEYAAKATAKKMQFLGEVSPAQSEVIDRHFALTAQKEWLIIRQTKAVLDYVNGKEVAKVTEKAEKAEKEEVLAD